MVMTCSECSAAAVAAGQRYCHVCGVLLPQGVLEAPGAPGAPGASSLTTPYLVGDGSDRVMSALTRGLTMEWLRANQGRIVVYGAGAAVALVAVITFIIAAVAVIVGLVATFVPVALALFMLYTLVRPRRRRRRLTRIYRF